MADLSSTVAVQNITVPPITTMLDHLVASNPHPQYASIADFPSLVQTQVVLSDIRDVIVPNSDINNTVLAWKNAAWRPTAISDIIDMSDLPEATTTTKGAVRLATMTDVNNRNASAAVTPDGMRAFLDSSGYTDAVTQKLQVARTKEQVIEAIVANSTNVISGMELAGGSRQYVLVKFPKSAPNNAVSADTQYSSARYPSIVSTINQSFADITVYRGGVVSGFILKDELSSYVSDVSSGWIYTRKPLNLIFKESAAGYDLVIKNNNYLNVENNAKVNRVMLSSNGQAFVSGTVHEAQLIGGDDSTVLARMVCYSHGHAEYLTIVSNARVEVGKGDTGGIVEHVQAINTFVGNNCAVQINNTGEAYHVVLKSANAMVYSGGYMEDVALYDGAFLTLHSGAVVKDLKAYQNAHIAIEDGVILEGLVRYQPTVTFGDRTKSGLSTVIDAGAICHTKMMLICQNDGRFTSTDYHVSYIQSGTGYVSAGAYRKEQERLYDWTRYSGGWASSATSQLKLTAAVAFFPDTASSRSEKMTNFSEFYTPTGSLLSTTSTESTYTYSTHSASDEDPIWVAAFGPPRGFLRVMPEAVASLNNATHAVLVSDGERLYSSAYQYHLINSIVGYRPSHDPDTGFYTVMPPEGFTETFNSNYEWYVTF